MLKTSTQLAAVILMGFLLTPGQAQKTKSPYAPSATELAMLPDFCQARLGTNAERYQQWNQRMGPNMFLHVHHYCQGLNHMNRAKFTFEKQQRREYLQTAANEFDYVLRRWPDGFDLKADAETKKMQAENLLRLL